MLYYVKVVVPSYKYLRVWGCLANGVVPTPKVIKIVPKTIDCLFIGYAQNNIAYRFLMHDSKIPEIHKGTIMELRNESFFEKVFPRLAKVETSAPKIIEHN